MNTNFIKIHKYPGTATYRIIISDSYYYIRFSMFLNVYELIYLVRHSKIWIYFSYIGYILFRFYYHAFKYEIYTNLLKVIRKYDKSL